MKTVDLHTHSTASDGTHSPTEVVRAAVESGLCALALTDHDTADGLIEAANAAKTFGIEFIPGIEISVSFMQKELHIVGLYLDISGQPFINAVKKLQENRDARNKKMIKQMQTAGIDITMEKLRASQGNCVLTRANFARYLMDICVISTIQEGFDKYLDEGKPFYIPRQYLSPETAIHLIHQAHGLAVLAHPLLYHLTESQLENTVRGLKELGLDGMEVYYSRNTAYDTPRLKKLAMKYDLVPSGGSDFHGTNKPDIQIGSGRGNLIVPYDVVAAQKSRLQKYSEV